MTSFVSCEINKRRLKFKEKTITMRIKTLCIGVPSIATVFTYKRGSQESGRGGPEKDSTDTDFSSTFKISRVDKPCGDAKMPSKNRDRFKRNSSKKCHPVIIDRGPLDVATLATEECGNYFVTS